MHAGGQRFESVILHIVGSARAVDRRAGSRPFIDILEQKRKEGRFLTGAGDVLRSRAIPRYAPRIVLRGIRKQERAHGGCLWLGKAMKGAASCEKLRGDASGL